MKKSDSISDIAKIGEYKIIRYLSSGGEGSVFIVKKKEDPKNAIFFFFHFKKKIKKKIE